MVWDAVDFAVAVTGDVRGTSRVNVPWADVGLVIMARKWFFSVLE